MPRPALEGASRVGASIPLLLTLLLPLASHDARAQERRRAPPRWSLELLGGSALSAPSPLGIRQRGAPNISLTAHYDTRPLRDAPYYMYRVGRWSGDGRRAWEVELLHHKLYLRDHPSEVQHFEVSHGYNMLLVDRALHFDRATVRLGAGAVVAHPESVVRGRSLAGGGGLFRAGYYVAGAAAQLAVGRRVALPAHMFLSLEGKATAAAARVPIADGHASVPNAAVHALVGLGVAR